jgi:hypothetical protein
MAGMRTCSKRCLAPLLLHPYGDGFYCSKACPLRIAIDIAVALLGDGILSSQFLKLMELDERFKRGQFIQVEPTQVDQYGTRCQVEERELS